jgi:acetolactate synthase-1/2/3 large subunit
MGKGVIDERHPQYLGTAALSSNDYLHEASRDADLIINVGHDVVEKPPFFMTRDGFQVLHVNYQSAQTDAVYFPQQQVVGDIANAIWQIKQGVTPQAGWSFDCFGAVRGKVESHTSSKADAPEFPVKPQRLVADVRRAMPDDGIISLDNGMYKIWFARNYKAHEPNTVLLDNALATMGAGLPAAMGAALVSPGRKVMAIAGDGGFMMNSQEMETAVRLEMDLVVLVLVDRGYGMIKWKMEDMGFEPWGLDFGNPDFVRYAESYGARGVRVEKTEDLLPTLQSALAAPGVQLVEVPVDYSENRALSLELDLGSD